MKKTDKSKYKTPDWTIDEEQICAKILDEVKRGKVKLYYLKNKDRRSSK